MITDDKFQVRVDLGATHLLTGALTVLLGTLGAFTSDAGTPCVAAEATFAVEELVLGASLLLTVP